MSPLLAYVARDRALALARQQELPSWTHGAALCADISGFTSFTEALARQLGSRRGAEELTFYLNSIYDLLIAEITRYGGSVISFAGDAIICWFDQDGGDRAVASALAMQGALAQLPPSSTRLSSHVVLGMKIAVASGPARRFTVGDPAIQLHDVLAGTAIERLFVGEQLARQGEVLVDAETAQALGERLTIVRWHDGAAADHSFAVVACMAEEPAPDSGVEAVAAPLTTPDEALLRPWLLPPVYARLVKGQGEFLAELRPCVALFLRFQGIDYTEPQAEAQLDGYIRSVQAVLARYESWILQLTIGDKGSYLYAAFGAPIAHEDDAERALKAALELRVPPVGVEGVSSVQIGLSQGVVRAGAYGSMMRRTYGALSDDVNLAARLMQLARPGQILADERMQQLLPTFAWHELPSARLKGKQDLIRAYSLQGAPQLSGASPADVGVHVGREEKLELLLRTLRGLGGGAGVVLGITGEAGMGKSWLVAQALSQARAESLRLWQGEAHSYGQHIPYLAWRPIWRACFELDDQDSAMQVEQLGARLSQLAPQLLPRLPLLGPILGLTLPDNDLTRGLEAELRKRLREDMLRLVLLAWFSRNPGLRLVLLLEDLHWLDPLSADLLLALAPLAEQLPVAIVLTYRPLKDSSGVALQLAQALRGLRRFSELALDELAPHDIDSLVQRRLALQGVEQDEQQRAALVEQIYARCQGNPFYITELLTYLFKHDGSAQDPLRWRELALPNSLHSLILGRIDQLNEEQRRALKVASIIGRRFHVTWLCGYYPELGDPGEAVIELEHLHELELIIKDAADFEQVYLFKHVITQDVAYESMPFATRSKLHERLAGYLESLDDSARHYLDLLAYHYERSENQAKKRSYLWQAGQVAQAAYANLSALDYYQRLLPLTDGRQQAQALLSMGGVYELMGDWTEAAVCYGYARAVARDADDALLLASGERAVGVLLRKRGDYGEAQLWLDRARAQLERVGDHMELTRTLLELATVYYQQSNLAPAQSTLERCVMLCRHSGDLHGLALALNVLGRIANDQGAPTLARDYYEQCLALYGQRGDVHGQARSLLNLGIVAYYQGQSEAARQYYEESLGLFRQIGDKHGTILPLMNLGVMADGAGDYEAARTLFEQTLAAYRELGDKAGIAIGLGNLGHVVQKQGDYAAARAMLEESIELSRELGDSYGVALSLVNLSSIDLHRGALDLAWSALQESLRLASELANKLIMVYTFTRMAAVLLALPGAQAQASARASRAVVLLGAAEAMLEEAGLKLDPDEQKVYADVLASAHAVLEPAGFELAWAEGRQIDYERLLAHVATSAP